MTYPCTECIMDLLGSSGPQTLYDIRQECREQAVPYSAQLLNEAIDQLLAAGRIVTDQVADDSETYYDFPPSYYNAQIN